MTKTEKTKVDEEAMAILSLSHNTALLLYLFDHFVQLFFSLKMTIGIYNLFAVTNTYLQVVYEYSLSSFINMQTHLL